MSTSSIVQTQPNCYPLIELVKTNDHVPYSSRVNFVIELIKTIESNRQKYSSGYILCNENWIDEETAKYIPENVYIDLEQKQTLYWHQPQLPLGYASIKAQRSVQQEKLTEKEEVQAVLINVSLILLKLFPNADTKHAEVWKAVKMIPWMNSLEEVKKVLKYLYPQKDPEN